MSNSKATRRALLTSILALVMCVSMLIGTTAAWFTDTVTSSGNKVISGTLKVDLEVLEGNNWISIKDNPQAIFDYENWEPGYVQVKILRVVNKGSLAFKWQASLVANAALGNLADVIDVYVKEDVTVYPTDRTEIDSWNKVGTLRDFVNTIPVATNGEILAKDKNATVYPSEVLAIAFKMQETAGNEYQDQTLGEFDIQILATQLMAEKDSFDEKYDAEAAWDGTYPTTKPDTLVVDTVNHIISINDTAAFAYLNTLVNDPDFYTNYGSKWKYSIELNTDVDLMNKAWTPILLSSFVAFDGKGHTISNVYVSTTEDDAGLFRNIACNDIGVTYVRNLNIDGAYIIGDQSVGALAGSSSQGVIENVTINNATVIGNKYVGGIFGSGNGSANGCTVKNTTVTIPEGGLKEAGGLIGYLSNDGNPTTENKIIANNTVENVVITAPTIASGLVSQPNSSNTGTGVIVIENNTMKNVKITTADDTADLYASNNVGGKSIVKDNTATECSLVKTVVDTNGLKDALSSASAGDTINVDAGTYTFPAGDFVEGTTVICEEGTVFNGTSSLNINGATVVGATFDADTSDRAATGSIDGTFKNCTFTGTHSLRYCYANAGDTIVFENCVFDPEVRGIHFDAGEGEIVFRNCTISGFNAIGSALIKATFEGCTFTYGRTAYNGLNLYCNTELKDCVFEFTGASGEFIDYEAAGKTLTITNCVVNVNGTPVDIATKIGGTNRNDTLITIDGVIVNQPNP